MRDTGSRSNSRSGPFFSLDLAAIKRGLKSLYSLPWVAKSRVTVDHQPPARKPKSRRSWYPHDFNPSQCLESTSNEIEVPPSDWMSAAQELPVNRRSRRVDGHLGRYSSHIQSERPRGSHRHRHRVDRRAPDTMSTQFAPPTPYAIPPIPSSPLYPIPPDARPTGRRRVAASEPYCSQRRLQRYYCTTTRFSTGFTFPNSDTYIIDPRPPSPRSIATHQPANRRSYNPFSGKDQKY